MGKLPPFSNPMWQGLKSEFNTLAPVCVSCVENGQSLAEKCEAGDPRTALEGDVSDLQAKWKKLGKLFGDLLTKLTEALVQVSWSFHCCSVLSSVVMCTLGLLLTVCANSSKIP